MMAVGWSSIAVYWAEYWCAARGAWCELLAPDRRPIAGESLQAVVRAAHAAAAGQPYRIIEQSAGFESVVFQLR